MTLVYAHRGSRTRAPENTLRAFELAIDEGADGVELDVRTCRSGEVVVVHDRDLWRVAGDATLVEDLGLSALRDRDVGAGERVPLLDEALDLVLDRGGRVNVEVKGNVPDRPGTARAVAHLLGRRSRRDRDAVLLSTFEPLVLLVLRESVPAVPVGFLFDGRHTGAVRASALRRWLRPDGLHPEERLATHGAIRRWHARGLFVNPWTVDDPARIRELADAGVDGVITNDPLVARRALDR